MSISRSAGIGGRGGSGGGDGSLVSLKFELMCAATSCTRQPEQPLGRAHSASSRLPKTASASAKPSSTAATASFDMHSPSSGPSGDGSGLVRDPQPDGREPRTGSTVRAFCP